MNTAEHIGRRLTVSAKWLTSAADALEEDAKASLQTWLILGQSHRYSETMAKASVLRRAADIKNIGDRRHFLRSNGVEA